MILLSCVSYSIGPIVFGRMPSIIDAIPLIVGVISIIFTVYFSRLQQQHNKNSVRPICEILPSDYEDCIAVRITNVGTGPLIIKKLRCCSPTATSSQLIDLMPAVSMWSTFMETLDGRTLPTSDQKLGLVELRSKSPHEKEAVRRALSKIVITVEYEDIYGTKFQTKQNLDFFERTL